MFFDCVSKCCYIKKGKRDQILIGIKKKVEGKDNK